MKDICGRVLFILINEYIGHIQYFVLFHTILKWWKAISDYEWVRHSETWTGFTSERISTQYWIALFYCLCLKLASIQATLTSYPYDFKASVLSLKIIEKYEKKQVHAA